jgi:diguanylate cyclase (GGDEF)-like protein
VLFLDLDRFKEVNDTLGHLIGDMLLVSVAERLSDSVRQGDTVARLAGDEFTIILEDIADFRDAAIVAEKVLRRLCEPFFLNGQKVQVTTSIGISIFPADGDDIETLVRNADSAMYRAKKGKNNYQFFSENLNAQAFERLALESSLRHALDRDELRLFFQPIYDLVTNRIVGAEALLRWQHPDVGLVYPAQLLPLADETGLILPIGRWVLSRACAEAMRWRDEGHGDLRVAVNMSPHQLRQPDVAEAVAAVLRESRLPPHLLELELPESVVVQHADDQTMLKKLKALGVRLSIDDFGTGYSSFGYLHRMPVDAIKIDQSYVRDIMTDADDAKIITAITALAHDLGIVVIAEGVENGEQHAFLCRHSCDQAQGYLFSRPVAADEFGRLLKDGVYLRT